MRQVAINMVETLARRDPRVVFIGSDLGPNVLAGMKRDMPERFFMEGVAEQHVIGMAAGLAMEGFVPYINTIATFLTRRCLDQIAIDLCMENLPARLIASGGGLVYAPLGPTHLAFEDMALLRALPNMAIVAPADAAEMERLMQASLDWPGPLYIRLAKGGDPVVSRAEAGFAIGKAIPMRPGGEVVLIGTGIMTGRALAAAERLAAQGIEAGVLHVHTVKPLDTEAVLAAADGARLLVTVEEHSRVGGLGSAVGEALLDHRDGGRPRLLRLALPDAFPEGYGSQDHLLTKAGLSVDGIAAAVAGALSPAVR
ncbi:transketolase family protein [Azospirillum isscasi]|uniref:Transketolase C-terminal domain-containing protein n=1 Tax=Azospirillum isscasi TaxID=3053926 RepID=A0ABU0WQM2_9PROT|nr:transketolase C-terminal domain-containing protein [Azospirillum isscasi]MDQ2105844.1 transketolase C-terminal domain-containing protein [Azospirillum isscasi]